MLLWEVLLMSVALAMDACAVAMANGMCDVKMPVKKALLIGAFFGFFQFLMPVIGYFITGIIADAFLDTFEKNFRLDILRFACLFGWQNGMGRHIGVDGEKARAKR